ncbi:MAG: HAD hydrolase-like protein [Bacteroidales bacterium]|nr:HAD hydrolase-like protein [Bacteroidales bacterium]MCF8458292.1 HAD hydrolase-like protein [Bacteroidales bacterium]
MKHLALFDMDGTLIDSRQLYFNGIPYITKKWLDMEISMEENMDLWGYDVLKWFERFTTQKGPGFLSLAKEMYADFEKWYIENHASMATCFEGFEKIFQVLKNSDYLIGIVTTRPQPRAELAYSLPWGGMIDFVIGGDRVENRKPAPDSINLAIELEGAQGGNHFYLGDAKTDILAARQSKYKVLSLAALWGSENPEALINANPDHLFKTVEDFNNWLISDFLTEK